MEDNLDVWAKVFAEKLVDMLMQNLKDEKVIGSIRKYVAEEQKRFQTSKFYFDKHTWAKVEPNWNVKVGLTNYALKQLKGLAKIQIDNVGEIVRRIEPFGVAETWIYMFDLYSPIAGTLVAANGDVLENTEKIDGNTWLIEVKPINFNALIKELEALMDEKKYNEYASTTERRITNVPTDTQAQVSE
jgi:glycine cleavage system H protein